MRENISYLQDFDENRFKEVVRVCSLNSELNNLESNQENSIGEKGDNLSGG
jgi:ABC-type bacteriocin/lantibiotic exporter with double-glycine peptidase domain